MTDTSGVPISGYDVRDMDERTRALLDGAIDLHVHPGPSPFPRRIGIHEAAAQAAAAGFRAIVVKSHHHSMVTDVLALAAATDLPIPVFSGVALNDHVGGINPHVVDLTLKMGGRVVWFPTISSDQHIHEHEGLKFPTSTKELLATSPIAVRDDQGDLLPDVLEVLALIRDEDGILAGGHLPVDDIDVLVTAASKMGLQRILIQHPNFVVGATPDQAARWSELGAIVEHSLCMYDDRSTFYHWEIDVMLDYMRAVGPERTALVSDLGQKNNPLPIESYEHIITLLTKAGVDEQTLGLMLRDVPARVLGI